MGYQNVGTNTGSTYSYTFFQGGNATRIYADPGTNVIVNFGTYNGRNPHVEVSISGYLLPSPEASR